MPPPSISLNPPKEILKEIHTAYARYEVGIFNQRETEKDIGLLIKKLRAYGTDCQLDVLQSAEEILTKIKNEPAPNGIFDKLRQVFLDWRGKSETFEKVHISKMSNTEWKKIKKESSLVEPCISGGQMHHTLDAFNGCPHELVLQLKDKVNTSLSADLQSTDPSIRRLAIPVATLPSGLNEYYTVINYSDPVSGLYVSIVVNQADKEVKIIFAGDGAPMENISTFLSREISIIKTALGIRTRSLEQAAHFTKTVIKAVAESQDLKDYKTVIRGFSKGGAEAVYAALAQPQPLPAICFASADLGGAHVRKLPKANVARAKEFITHIHVQGDLVPNCRYIVHSLRPLGREFVIPRNHTIRGTHNGIFSTIFNYQDTSNCK